MYDFNLYNMVCIFFDVLFKEKKNTHDIYLHQSEKRHIIFFIVTINYTIQRDTMLNNMSLLIPLEIQMKDI